MPWQEMSPMDERVQFIADHQRGLYAMTELCARYGISRKTGYKWLARYALEGACGLVERSHAPQTPALLPIMPE
jgi:putative transposase